MSKNLLQSKEVENMSRVPEEELNIKLPSGFHLEEEGDFLFLFFGEKKIANFTATGVNPKEVEKEANEYLESLGRNTLRA